MLREISKIVNGSIYPVNWQAPSQQELSNFVIGSLIVILSKRSCAAKDLDEPRQRRVLRDPINARLARVPIEVTPESFSTTQFQN